MIGPTSAVMDRLGNGPDELLSEHEYTHWDSMCTGSPASDCFLIRIGPNRTCARIQLLIGNKIKLIMSKRVTNWASGANIANSSRTLSKSSPFAIICPRSRPNGDYPAQLLWWRGTEGPSTSWCTRARTG